MLPPSDNQPMFPCPNCSRCSQVQTILFSNLQMDYKTDRWKYVYQWQRCQSFLIQMFLLYLQVWVVENREHDCRMSKCSTSCILSLPACLSIKLSCCHCVLRYSLSHFLFPSCRMHVWLVYFVVFQEFLISIPILLLLTSMSFLSFFIPFFFVFFIFPLTLCLSDFNLFLLPFSSQTVFLKLSGF